MSVRRLPWLSPRPQAQARAAPMRWLSITRNCRPWSTSADALKPGAPQLHPEAEGNLIFDWEIGDEDATKGGLRKGRHVTKMEMVNNRLVPNPMEPRAALADYDTGRRALTRSIPPSQNPHVARLVIVGLPMPLRRSTSCA
jgi:CO/xanthine dehydrogenase Mo-binding subunit